MISLTEKAANKILEISSEEGLENQNIRIKIIGGGCAGFSNDLYFDDEAPLPFDECFESFGVKIVIDPLSYQYLEGSIIDYIKNNFSSGFKFNNPNVVSTCACGSSVGF